MKPHILLPIFALLCLAGFLRASEAEIIEALKGAGAQITLDKDGNASKLFIKDSSAVTPDQYKQIGQLTKLQSITMYNKCTITDETLEFLKGLENLQSFAVDGAHISDDGMKTMANWKSLKSLTYFHNFWNKEKFTGAGVVHLAELPNFESFSCGGSTFTNAGMDALAKIKKLRELRLWHDSNTDEGNAKLATLENLKFLRLAGQFTTRLTEASIPHVIQIKSLESLSLGETRLSYAALSKLKELPNLKSLELEKVDISDEDLAKLKTDLPNVKFTVSKPDETQLANLRKAFDKK